MCKVAESQPVKEAYKVAELLKTLGFNITFLRSQEYVLNKLSDLNDKELNMLKRTFSENKHPRFMKEFSFHDAYGKSRFYRDALKTADLEKLTKLIGICSLLMQVKVYLFWANAHWNSPSVLP
jgi:hypothetical protein